MKECGVLGFKRGSSNGRGTHSSIRASVPKHHTPSWCRAPSTHTLLQDLASTSQCNTKPLQDENHEKKKKKKSRKFPDFSGFELTTLRLRVWCAVQLGKTSYEMMLMPQTGRISSTYAMHSLGLVRQVRPRCAAGNRRRFRRVRDGRGRVLTCPAKAFVSPVWLETLPIDGWWPLVSTPGRGLHCLHTTQSY